MSQEVGFGGASFGLAGGTLKVSFSKAFEKCPGVGGVGGGIRIVDDYIVKISGNAFKAFDDLVIYLDEPAGGGTAALRA